MLQKIGLIIFVAAFGLFIGTIGMNNYILTNEILEKNFKEDALVDAKIELASMVDQSYSNSFSFASELSEGVNQLNKVYNTKQAWDKKIYEDTILSIVKASAHGYLVDNKGIMFLLTFGMFILGSLLFILPESQKPAGIKNNGIYFNPAMNRKWLGISIGTFLILFYITLYFKPPILSR